MRRVTLSLVSLAAVFVLTSSSPAATQLDVGKCLRLTTTTKLSINAILEGIGLTPDQTRELRSRLSQSNSARLDGVGLTPEQQATIQRRIDAQVARMNRYPLGWPCAVFKNPTKTSAFVRRLLIDNGYRATLRIWKTSPRQFQLRGIQDGIDTLGIVAKSGPRQIVIYLTSPSDRYSQTKRFTTSFEP